MSNLAIDKTLSTVFYQGDSSASQTGNHFRMALPTAISLQGDYRLQDHVYINATIVKGLGHGDRQGVVQPDLYAVTPRYESQYRSQDRQHGDRFAQSSSSQRRAIPGYGQVSDHQLSLEKN